MTGRKSPARPRRKRIAGKVALSDARVSLENIKLRVPEERQSALRKAIVQAVETYYDTPAPSEFAEAVRRGFADDMMPELVEPYAPPGLTVRSRLLRGQAFVRTGGRTRRKTYLMGQTRAGFPGRAPERALVAFLAAAWSRAGQSVTSGGKQADEPALSPFEELVEDVLVALQIDDQVSARSLVRQHIEEREGLASSGYARTFCHE
jgi:hypothetical protein